MAVYAALISLMNNMEQIMSHPHLSTSLDRHQILSLREKVEFFLDFIENHREAGDSVYEIASPAHEAEDVIESHIIDQIHAGSNKKSLACLLHLQKVLVEMDSIKEKFMKLKEEGGFKDQHPKNPISAASSRPVITGKNTMVGFDSYLIQLLDELTGQQCNRQIMSIVGMGGIGKTTLARNVYEHSIIVQHFDVCAWVTISQDYNVKQILLKALSLSPTSGMDERTESELGEQLHKSLSGRRYLVILDDMWDIEVWNKIKIFFPDNRNRSRVVLTTRLSHLAIQCGSFCFRMNILDEYESWNLFCEKLFGKPEDCPPELKKTGREIARLCKGLPLSISVIGGLLQKSCKTIRYWQDVAKNINSILNSEENEHCLNILSLSYNHLPAHLKPCLLYVGVFEEDREISVSKIIKLWVAEGFIKPNGAQILEEIAVGYLEDLIERNLISVAKHGSNGKIKSCRIHDLLRDLCLRMATKEKLYCIAKLSGISRVTKKERRLVFHDLSSKGHDLDLHAWQSASFTRSLLICSHVGMLPVKLKLLRVLNTYGKCSLMHVFQSFNLRILDCNPVYISQIPSSVSLMWNLQMLIIKGGFAGSPIVAPIEIWKMQPLRHLECEEIYLPEPRSSNQGDDLVVLGNLQTLSGVVNFRWSEEACRRIPNIKKLRVRYGDILKRIRGVRYGEYDDVLYYNLHILCRLQKLKSLNIRFLFGELQMHGSIYLVMKSLEWSSSLIKLSLGRCRLHWEDLTIIGSLPQLEVLKLKSDSAVEGDWSPVEGEFLRLKFLEIAFCDLRIWTANSSHFPVLEKLLLVRLRKLEEIPLGIGEIPTLQLIYLDYCAESAQNSAINIKEEQESLGNYGLQIHVISSESPLGKKF